MWFTLLSGLGAVSLMTRTVPQYLANGDVAGLRKLVTNLLALRAGTGVAPALTYFPIIVAVLREPDVVAATLVAGGVLGRTIGDLCFSLSLGLTRLRSGAPALCSGGARRGRAEICVFFYPWIEPGCAVGPRRSAAAVVDAWHHARRVPACRSAR